MIFCSVFAVIFVSSSENSSSYFGPPFFQFLPHLAKEIYFLQEVVTISVSLPMEGTCKQKNKLKNIQHTFVVVLRFTTTCKENIDVFSHFHFFFSFFDLRWKTPISTLIWYKWKKKLVSEMGFLMSKGQYAGTGKPRATLTHLVLDNKVAILADDIFKCIFLNSDSNVSEICSHESNWR